MKNELEWFLPDPSGISPIGPKSTEEIVQMIKSKKLEFDDFISCPQIKNEAWLRVFEFDHFHSLFKGKPICPPPKLFSKGVRKNPPLPEEKEQEIEEIASEAKLTGRFIIHNNNKSLKGNLITIADQFAEGSSEKNDLFKMGDEVYLTVFNSPQVKSFSILSVVIGKEEKNSKVNYKFYFLRINPEVKRRIHFYLQQSAKN